MDSDEANKQDESEAESEDDSDESEEDELGEKLTVEDVLIQAQQRQQYSEDLVEPVKVMICCVCLGDRSDATNEIVECDGCGVTVHEGCYGVSENDSVSSTVSSCSTMPWFCEACRAGIDNPTCELCPNSGGIFKETDVGKWVHLVCALYIPGVAFGEVDKLASVTLFEMAYSKWGAKSCQFCPDQRFTRTGVAIGCDAGMCRTFFHVTCGQREGLLSEAHSEEVDQADPFYAHCKLHSDKTLMRKRRRNWLALELRTAQRKKEYESEGHKDLPEQQRIQRKLGKYRSKYSTGKITKPSPWVPTQKMARMLTSSASACRALWRKAELSGVDTEAWALREAQAAALADVHRKWHIPPAFSVEFIGYYLDRNARMETMRRQLSELLDENGKLRDDQKSLQAAYDEINKENAEEVAINTKLKALAEKYHELILFLAPNKKLPLLETLCNPVTYAPTVLMASHPRHPLATSTGGVPTAAALKAGVGFPLGLRRQESAPLALNNECGICHRTTDQHLLAKCDTCYLYYHLGCLNPPLTRMPKKTKLMGWQCSECDKESSGSEVECIDPEAPRKLRTPKESNGDTSVSKVKGPVTPTSFVAPVNLPDTTKTDTNIESLEEQLSSPVLPIAEDSGDHSGRSNKKRRREKHHRYSPEPSGSSQIARPHKRKRKRKSQDSPKEGEHRPALKICKVSDPSNQIKTNTASTQPETHSSLAATLPNCRKQSLNKPFFSHNQNKSKCRISLTLNRPSKENLKDQSLADNINTPVIISVNKNKLNSLRSQSSNKAPSLEKKQCNRSSLAQQQLDKHYSVDQLENSVTSLATISSIDRKFLNSNSSHDKNHSPNQNLNNCSLENLHIKNSVSGYNQLDNSPLSRNRPADNIPVSFYQNQSDNQKKISHSQSLQQSNETVLHYPNQPDNQNPTSQSIYNNHPSAYVSNNNYSLAQNQPDHHIPTDQNLADTHPSRSVANFFSLAQNHLYNQMLDKSLPENHSSLSLSDNIFSHNQKQSNQSHSSYNQNILCNFTSSAHNLPIHNPTQDHNIPKNISTSNSNSLTHGISEQANHFSSLGLLNSLFYQQSPYPVHYPAPYNLHPEQLNHISMNHCLNSCLHGPPAFSPQPFPTSRHPACGMFKSIPHPTGEGSAYVATPGGGVYQASTPRPMFVTSHPAVPRVQAATPRPPAQITQRVTPQTVSTTTRVSTGVSKKPKESDKPVLCDTCNTLGTNANLVRCDECMKGFHFSCLDPPVKKSPKVRGYSWHCANCDPTESDSS